MAGQRYSYYDPDPNGDYATVIKPFLDAHEPLNAADFPDEGGPAEDQRPRTVGELRAALERVPDDTLVEVITPGSAAQDRVRAYEVSAVGYGVYDWGDGHGMRVDRTTVEITTWPAPGNNVRPAHRIEKP